MSWATQVYDSETANITFTVDHLHRRRANRSLKPNINHLLSPSTITKTFLTYTDVIKQMKDSFELISLQTLLPFSLVCLFICWLPPTWWMLPQSQNPVLPWSNCKNEGFGCVQPSWAKILNDCVQQSYNTTGQCFVLFLSKLLWKKENWQKARNHWLLLISSASNHLSGDVHEALNRGEVAGLSKH